VKEKGTVEDDKDCKGTSRDLQLVSTMCPHMNVTMISTYHQLLCCSSNPVIELSHIITQEEKTFFSTQFTGSQHLFPHYALNRIASPVCKYYGGTPLMPLLLPLFIPGKSKKLCLSRNM
jgi:hypothetical protein